MELLEKILFELTDTIYVHSHVLPTMRVSTFWRDTIAGSVLLQRRFWFLPQMAEEEDFENTGTIDGREDDSQSFTLQSGVKFNPFNLGEGAVSFNAHDVENRSASERGKRPFYLHHGDSAVVVVVSDEIFEYPGGRWVDLIFANKDVDLYVYWEDEDNDDRYPYKLHFRAETTMGMVYERIKRLVREWQNRY